jgi:hypothetical protein
MEECVKSPKGTGVVAFIAVLAAMSWLPYQLKAGAAAAQQSRACSMNPVQQSICIYQAILADVAKTYRLTGGGGISSIVQDSTTAFTVHIAQEGRTDLLNYSVKIGAGGKVEIVGRTESTQSR